MYSFPNFEPIHCFMSSSNCCFLTCIQVSQEAGKVVWYSYLFKNFPQFIVIHIVKGFSIVNEAEVDVFLELHCIFYDSVDVGNLISGSSAFSKSSLYIWTFSVHVLLKPTLKDFEHYLTSMCKEHNCVVVWTFVGIALLIVVSSLFFFLLEFFLKFYFIFKLYIIVLVLPNIKMNPPQVYMCSPSCAEYGL